MQTDVTVRADDTLLERAKERARKEWLHRNTGKVSAGSAKEFDDFMDRVRYANPGRTFSREEMNAR